MKLEVEISNKLLAKIMNCAKAQGKLVEEFIIEVLDNTCNEISSDKNFYKKLLSQLRKFEVNHG